MRKRPLWLTFLLYAIYLVVAAVDVGAALFWARVGGSLGTAVALVAGGIALLAVLLLASDLTGQVRLRSAGRAGHGDRAARPRGPSRPE